MAPVRQRVRVYLAEQGMTQADLARRLGVSDAALSLILHGKNKPSLDLAVKLEDITGIPAREFAEVA